MNQHATIKLGDYTIPLVGLPVDCTLQECSLCHDMFGIQEVELAVNGRDFYCRQCRGVTRLARNLKIVSDSC